MSFDGYIQIVFSTIIPAIIATIIEIFFSKQNVKRKYIVVTIGVWGLIFIVITVIYFLKKQNTFQEISNNTVNSNEKITTGDQSPVIIDGGVINIIYGDNFNNISTESSVSDSVDEEESKPINSNIVEPLIIKEDKLVVPPNPVKHDIQIILDVSSNSYPEEEIGIYNNNKEKELLYKAKELCENKKYDEAITIYVCDELKDNPYAKINIGYLYAHGYGYKEDVETALKIYDSIDMDIAKRNKLALLITSNTNGNNDVAISDLIDYFTDKNDYYVQNYITNCLYHKNVESLSEEEKNITCTLEDLYILECAGTINSANTYSLNSAYKKLVYNGITYEGEYIKSACYHYIAYQYMYLDWLEKIYS